MKRRSLDHAKLARNLGSQPCGRVPSKSGYFGALELAAEVRRRFKSPATGGRATDWDWTAKRLIPMRTDTLARLQELAKEVSRYAKCRVEPLQLAALIIECHLASPTRTPATRGSLRRLSKYRGKVASKDNLDELRQRGVDADARPAPSGLDLVRDLVGSVKGPPDLSTNRRYLRGYGR